MSNTGHDVDIVTYLLKAGIAELVKMSVARQGFSKHVYRATESRDRRKNTTVGNSVLYAVRPEAIYR
jgi:hypothetical protein